MKRYVGGLGVSALISQHIGLVGNWRKSGTDDLGDKLHCFAAFVVSTTKAQNRNDCMYSLGDTSDVRRFDVKDSTLVYFELESLILAQNERWRQA